MYNLRMLFNIQKVPTSFEDIIIVNGTMYNTFKQACYVLGLLNDDKEWNDVIREATH